MRRPVLVALMVVGAVVAAVSGTGLFAALVDTADTGLNSVESAEQPASSDLKIVAATTNFANPDPDLDMIECGSEWSDDLTTPFFTVTNNLPGYGGSPAGFLCVTNAGSQTVNLEATVPDLIETDFACTGDEALYDTTCGNDDVGDLGQYVSLGLSRQDCHYGNIQISEDRQLTAWYLTDAVPYGELAPGEVACFGTNFQQGSGAPNLDQATQTDRVQWRHRFIGYVPEP
jgi:hypothetical protein